MFNLNIISYYFVIIVIEWSVGELYDVLESIPKDSERKALGFPTSFDRVWLSNIPYVKNKASKL